MGEAAIDMSPIFDHLWLIVRSLLPVIAGMFVFIFSFRFVLGRIVRFIVRKITFKGQVIFDKGNVLNWDKRKNKYVSVGRVQLLDEEKAKLMYDELIL
jgi:hypothetical protein